MKKEHEKTIAQELFHDKQIINERPPNMTMEEYKAVRYLQSRLIGKLFKHKPMRRIERLMQTKFRYNSH